MTAVLDRPGLYSLDSRRAAIDSHMLASHLRLGGTVEAVGPVRLFTNPAFSWTFFNTARQTAPIFEVDIPALIQRVTQHYQRLALRPAWDVSLAAAPHTLTHHLNQAGFTLDRHETVMALALTRQGPSARPLGGRGEGRGDNASETLRCAQSDRASLPSLSLRPITQSILDTFVHAWRQGFAMGADTPMYMVRSLFTRDLEMGWEFWVAWREGRAVGTLALYSLDGVTQFANISTLPEYRRQGIATFLMRYGLSVARAKGNRLAFLHAATASPAERLYHHLGFETIDTWLTYVSDGSGS